MIFRRTEWRDDEGNLVQIELTALSDHWEAIWSSFVPVGPFDQPQDVWAELEGSWQHYLRRTGVPLELF